MWFISTIIQFYLAWPLILKLANKWGLFGALMISLSWSTLVYLMGKSDERGWNSFFLQYLWEFVLGMYLAKLFLEPITNSISEGKCSIRKFTLPSMGTIAFIGSICVIITGISGVKGGFFKLYNDIPSLFGYTSILLLIYKVRLFNKTFVYINCFSYEWYLVHAVVFACVYRVCNLYQLGNSYKIAFAFIASLLIAKLYHLVIKKVL